MRRAFSLSGLMVLALISGCGQGTNQPTAAIEAATTQASPGGWNIAADQAAVAQHFTTIRNLYYVDVTAAFDQEASSVYPRMTAAEWMRCFFGSEMTVERARALGLVLEHDFRNLIPDPNWAYPIDNSKLADEGFRVYIADLSTAVQVEQPNGDSDRHESTGGKAHIAVHPDGRIIHFPVCEEAPKR